MEIIYIAFAKPDDAYINEGCTKYQQKIPHYIKFQYQILPALKNNKSLSQEQQKQKEGEKILAQIQNSDYVVLLDEKGHEKTSVEFSKFIEKQSITGLKRLIFISGGPYGFSTEVYDRANYKLSLSKMTFSHQMVQLFFLEQLYRACSISKNEPYHH
jgi:23S rRNA (pseudouridine1915-N3)-methyltransferase